MNALQSETDRAELAVEDVQDWLATQIAAQIGSEPDEIDFHTPFHRFGLNSVQAMDIAQLGQQQFGIQLSPLAMWNCPNVTALAEHVVSELADSETFEI